MIDIDNLFTEDAEQYYDVRKQYLELNSENYAGAFELTKMCFALADRWLELATMAKKLATKDISKTDISDLCYRRYRQMQLAHEHCRMIWNAGNKVR